MNQLDHIRIVLCQPSHPGNIGSAARAMKTMGLSRLMLVKPRSFPNAEAEALASGATDVLKQATLCQSLDEALAGCALSVGLTSRKRELSHPAIPVREAAAEAIGFAARQDVAIVFGNETFGLSNDELIRCQRLPSSLPILPTPRSTWPLPCRCWLTNCARPLIPVILRQEKRPIGLPMKKSKGSTPISNRRRSKSAFSTPPRPSA